MSEKTTFIATGDSFITRRLPAGGYDGFEIIKNIIESHDVRFNNLEVTAHESEGYPAAFSGGTWAMANPGVLDDLKTYGFNIFNTANNHSCDYCHGGLLATIRNLRERGMLFAGTGATLYEASAPCYLETKNARVALLGICSTIHSADAAGNQSIHMSGRPGLNPLRFNSYYCVKRDDFDMLNRIASNTCMNAQRLMAISNGYENPPAENEMEFGQLKFKCADSYQTHTEPMKKDMERMTRMIEEAKRQADYVLVSVHSHEFAGADRLIPAEFLVLFSHACIDAGADAILGHGPHELRGVELYKEKPIFYSLGNFIFQTETVELQPAEAYENAGMPHDTLVGDYMNKRSNNGTKGYDVQKPIWDSVMASFTASNGRIESIYFYPISLGMGVARGRLGHPRLIKDDVVIQYLSELSKPFGTVINCSNGIGSITL
ncbi:MAG: CapA family protein [Clostridiales bacterium]|nr:CapA family protein [Clostridiales bacterium]